MCCYYATISWKGGSMVSTSIIVGGGWVANRGPGGGALNQNETQGMLVAGTQGEADGDHCMGGDSDKYEGDQQDRKPNTYVELAC